jgi:cytochrome b
MKNILVWDLPVRLGHWLLVGGFVVAWLTSESESLRLVHALAGSTVIGVIVFRLFWGFAGTAPARFASFVRGPRAVFAYLRNLLGGHPDKVTGHNPAGGWAIVVLLALAILSGLAGWAIYNDSGGHWLEEVHEGLATAMLAMVIVHIAGVLSGSLLHGENLVRAMVNGCKQGTAEQAIASAHPLAAFLLLVWVAGAGWLVAS